MNNGTNCPKCKADIGIKSIMLAITPNRIKCPNCNAKLRYRKSNLITVLSFVALIFAMPLSVSLQGKEFLIFLTLLVTIWFVVELVVATYLRKYKILKLVKPRQIYIFKKYKFSGMIASN